MSSEESPDSVQAQRDKRSHKAATVLVSIICGGPFIYLGLILVVVYNPEITTWLGLEPFAQYLVQLHPKGYQHLTWLNDAEFADYFFRFYAASLLIIGVLLTATIICAASLSKNSIAYKKMLTGYKHQRNGEGNSLSKVIFGYFSLLMILCLSLWWILFLPVIPGSGGKVSVLDGKMGDVIFGSIISVLGLTATVSLYYAILVNHAWPKFKSWLTNKQKADH
jgi:hypothetical protein